MRTTQKRTQSLETRLAERFGSLYRSRMARWTEGERYALADAVLAAGDTFVIRRLLVRLERGELQSFEDCIRAITPLKSGA